MIKICPMCGKEFKAYRKAMFLCGPKCRGEYQTKHTLESFWDKVDIKTPELCWEWKAGKDDKGYGKMGRIKGEKSAHRLAYTLTYGSIPENSLIRHLCNNPSCCNPNHLKPGSCQDNMDDMVRSNRSNKGEAKYCAKLTEAAVLEIRRLKTTGKFSNRQLARMYGMSSSSISYIITRKNWKHI